MNYDIIIIGAGPAGMTAAIYCARKKLRTLVWTRDIGGQAAWSSDIENYPGFTMLRGTELVEKFEHHLEEFKDEVALRLTTAGIAKIEPADNGFTVTAADGKTETARVVIIAGGKIPLKLNVPGEAEFLNKGVTYCSWCDGPLFRGKDIMVVGGGNAAADSALNVQKFVKQIYLVNNLDRLTADPLVVEKLQQAANIRIMNKCELKAIKGDQAVNAATITDHSSGTDRDIPVQGVFIEIGSKPATEYLRGTVELNQQGEVQIDANNMTSVPGIFAAGDITAVSEKQIVIAAGEGAKAAICASQYLSKQPTP